MTLGAKRGKTKKTAYFTIFEVTSSHRCNGQFREMYIMKHVLHMYNGEVGKLLILAKFHTVKANV